MAEVPSNLPELLQSRPKRFVIENQNNQSITIDPVPGRPPAYLITKCENTSLDFTNCPRLSQIMFEDCGTLNVKLCPVIGTVDLIKCENMDVEISAGGTTCIDMCSSVRLRLPVEQKVYTSTCTEISITSGEERYVLPPMILQASRSKTWYHDGRWATEKSNLYGDV